MYRRRIVSSLLCQVEWIPVLQFMSTLSQPLENISRKAVLYAPIRLSRSNLLNATIMADDASAYQWLTRMRTTIQCIPIKGIPDMNNGELLRFVTLLPVLRIASGALKGEVDAKTTDVSIIPYLTGMHTMTHTQFLGVNM